MVEASEQKSGSPSPAVIVIPARYSSTRLPGKPLTVIHGRSMIERVWRIARAADSAATVVVATDDARIAEQVTAFGGTAVMTPVTCKNGTERAQAAIIALGLHPEVVINLQGDAPLTPPWIVAALIAALRDDPTCRMATPAVRLSGAELEKIVRAKEKSAASGTFVTFDRNHNALYFSKAPIPFLRERISPLPVFKHIGLYGYRAEALAEYLRFEPTPLESVEGLEQLRALEHGMKIRVVEVDYRGRSSWSVDSPADVAEVAAIIGREGELVTELP